MGNDPENGSGTDIESVLARSLTIFDTETGLPPEFVGRVLEVVERRGPAIREAIEDGSEERRGRMAPVLDLIDRVHPPE